MANSKPLLTVETNYPCRATFTETDDATDIRQLALTGKSWAIRHKVIFILLGALTLHICFQYFPKN
jgi:hypothetical protein